MCSGPMTRRRRRPDITRSEGVDKSVRRSRASALLGLLLGVLVLGGGATILAQTVGPGGVAAAETGGPPGGGHIDPHRTIRGRDVRTTAAVSPGCEQAVAESAGRPRSASAPSPTPRPAPVSAPRPTPGPAPVSARAAAPAAAPSTDPVTFVQRYYALLPGNTDAAFALLGPQARSQAGGAAGFSSFYARMQSVTVHDARLVGDNTVNATVRFVQKDRTTSDEPYRFVMTADNSGRMIMESFSRV